MFFEYDFYCEENAEFDARGDEVYVETVCVSITSIQGISNKGISYVSSNDCISEIFFADAYRIWRKKHRVNKSASRYVCDRTVIDGERRMVFYGNPRVTVIATEQQEELWFELIEKMKAYGYYSFDGD